MDSLELARQFHPPALEAMQRHWHAAAWSLSQNLLVPELRELLQEAPPSPGRLSDALTVGVRAGDGSAWAGTVGEYHRVYVCLQVEGRLASGRIGALSVVARAGPSESEAIDVLVDRVEALEADGF